MEFETTRKEQKRGETKKGLTAGIDDGSEEQGGKREPWLSASHIGVLCYRPSPPTHNIVFFGKGSIEDRCSGSGAHQNLSCSLACSCIADHCKHIKLQRRLNTPPNDLVVNLAMILVTPNTIKYPLMEMTLSMQI